MNIEFLIASSARQRIDSLVNELKRKIGKSDVIPAVVWIDAEANHAFKTSGPAIAFYDNRDDVDDISVADGFEFVLAIPSEHEPIFDGKVLHDIDEAFVLK